MLLHPLQRLAPAEVARAHLLAELLPAQRRGHRRARLRPDGVGGGDRLPVPVLAVVDEDAPALLLQPLGGHEAGVVRLEPARHELREVVGVPIRRPPGDRHQHVDAVGAARLRVRPQPELFERLADEVRHPDRLREAVARLGRVEVEDDVVRALGLVDPRVPRVHVDAVHLHHPDEGGRLVDEREVDEPRLAFARPGAELPRRDPRGLALRRLLVEVRLAVDAVRIPLERERPVAQVRDDHVSDRERSTRARSPFVTPSRGKRTRSGCVSRTVRRPIWISSPWTRHRMHCGASEWRPRSRFRRVAYGTRSVQEQLDRARRESAGGHRVADFEVLEVELVGGFCVQKIERRCQAGHAHVACPAGDGGEVGSAVPLTTTRSVWPSPWCRRGCRRGSRSTW